MNEDPDMIRKPHLASLGLVALLPPLPAHAHHAMGGALPETVFQSLVSGLAHPVIGIDHLAFVVLVGLLAARTGRRAYLAGGFALATVAGCLLFLADTPLPFAELAIAGSVVILGALLLRADLPTPRVLDLAVPMAGLFHGWAYGAAILGAETGVIPAYLAGFGIVQFGIAMLAAVVSVRLRETFGMAAARERIAAAACMGVGFAVMLETVEGMAFAV